MRLVNSACEEMSQIIDAGQEMTRPAHSGLEQPRNKTASVAQLIDTVDERKRSTGTEERMRRVTNGEHMSNPEEMVVAIETDEERTRHLTAGQPMSRHLVTDRKMTVAMEMEAEVRDGGGIHLGDVEDTPA